MQHRKSVIHQTAREQAIDAVGDITEKKEHLFSENTLLRATEEAPPPMLTGQNMKHSATTAETWKIHITNILMIKTRFREL